MDDIWIISWFNHTAFDANPIWKSPIGALDAVQQGMGQARAHIGFIHPPRELRRFPNGVGIKCTVIEPAYHPYIIHI